jgi:GNAT superfamily N-acetyltransferase
MTIVLFDPSRDMQSVVSLYQQCFAEPPWNERFDPNKLKAEFEEMLTWPDTRFLVSMREGKVIAATIGFHVRRKPDVLELLDPIDQKSFYAAELFVDPHARQCKVGSELLTILLSLARYQGLDRVTVRTSTAQSVVQHLFLDNLGCKIVVTQDVVSTKWLDGRELQVPDQRIIMAGRIPVRIERLALMETYYTGMCSR